jgi:hypothetical protein
MVCGDTAEPPICPRALVAMDFWADAGAVSREPSPRVPCGPVQAARKRLSGSTAAGWPHWARQVPRCTQRLPRRSVTSTVGCTHRGHGWGAESTSMVGASLLVCDLLIGPAHNDGPKTLVFEPGQVPRCVPRECFESGVVVGCGAEPQVASHSHSGGAADKPARRRSRFPRAGTRGVRFQRNEDVADSTIRVI